MVVLLATLAATAARDGSHAADAARPALRDLRAASTVSVQTLRRDGLLVRLRAPSGTRVVALRLYRTHPRSLVATRRFTVRRGGAERLRWRFASGARLRAGRHELQAQAGRSRLRLGSRRLTRAITLTSPAAATTPPPPAAAGEPVVVAAAGDISCAGTCGQGVTADLISDTIRPTAVLGLGDYQYETTTLGLMEQYYTPTWGRFRDRTYPINGGSHDLYGTGDYLTYFNAHGPVALQPEGSYSFDLGSWHLIALNASCFVRSSCDTSAWTAWLRNDLATRSKHCTLAYFHEPYWTTKSMHDRMTALRPWIELLYDAGADVVLQAHNHVYERFAPQDPADRRDDARGLVAFTVGTGGRSHYAFSGDAAPNSLVRNADTYGVLKLVLAQDGYDFAFVPQAGRSFSDSGSGRCH
ncbi:MAG: acid phosphatase type 7 [Solirubrobacteraceae bacterium]|nr:acid phosphatase type 7 [Solirubrobacteraceae bacterium]